MTTTRAKDEILVTLVERASEELDHAIHNLKNFCLEEALERLEVALALAEAIKRLW